MKKTLAELENQHLKWIKPSFWKNDYELRDEYGDVLATIRRPRWWSYTVEVEATGNRWIFERKGFWRHRVIVRSAVTGDAAATFHYTFSGGRLEYPDGRVYYWKSGNFWGTKWVWTDEDGEPIVGFQTGGALKLTGSISLDPDADTGKAPTLLIFLGWYLIVIYHEESASMVAAGT